MRNGTESETVTGDAAGTVTVTVTATQATATATATQATVTANADAIVPVAESTGARKTAQIQGAGMQEGVVAWYVTAAAPTVP